MSGLCPAFFLATCRARAVSWSLSSWLLCTFMFSPSPPSCDVFEDLRNGDQGRLVRPITSISHLRAPFCRMGTGMFAYMWSSSPKITSYSVLTWLCILWCFRGMLLTARCTVCRPQSRQVILAMKMDAWHAFCMATEAAVWRM